MSKNHQTSPLPRTTEQQRSVFVLIIAIIAVSSAAPLVKSISLNPLLIAFWRTFIISAVLLFSLRKHHFPISKQNIALSSLAGIFLAFHFWTWFSSLQMIGSLRSTTLVCLNPIWVGLLEFVFWKRSHSKYFWSGTILAILGISVMSYSPIPSSDSQVQGDILALLGGFLGALYLLIGQKVRQNVDIQPYGFIVCISATISLSLLCFYFNLDFLVDNSTTWLILLALAIGPQFMGHIGLNYCLKHLPASTISLSLLLEPIGASLLSILFFQEFPTMLETYGSIIILFGVAIGLKNLRS